MCMKLKPRKERDGDCNSEVGWGAKGTLSNGNANIACHLVCWFFAVFCKTEKQYCTVPHIYSDPAVPIGL